MIIPGRIRCWSYVLVLAGAIALAGCAGLQTSQTETTEQLLSAAGFRMKLADTPAKQTHLKTLVQHQLVPYNYKGKVVYVYADAANNRLFVGDQHAYQKFQSLAVQRQISQEEATAAAENYGAAMNWDIWGPYPWGPTPWLY